MVFRVLARDRLPAFAELMFAGESAGNGFWSPAFARWRSIIAYLGVESNVIPRRACSKGLAN
jgi:hypothetical protein